MRIAAGSSDPAQSHFLGPASIAGRMAGQCLSHTFCVPVRPDGSRSNGAGAARWPHKRMQLTKHTAAPVLQTEGPPCAPAAGTDGHTASQLIRSVGGQT
jgi:hypothetical protein